MRLQTVAKAIIVNKQQQLLLIRRSQTDTRRPGEWDFPGGYIEPGEAIETGLIREINEEVGLKAESNKLTLIYTATNDYDDLSVCRLLFVGRGIDGEIKLSYEHDDFKWVDYQTGVKLFPHPFYTTGLKYAIEHSLLDINTSE